jgi:hypothetical protein
MTECWAEDPAVRPSFSEILRILEVLPTNASAFDDLSLSATLSDSDPENVVPLATSVPVEATPPLMRLQGELHRDDPAHQLV